MHTYLTSLVIFGPKLGGRKNILISTVSLFCVGLLSVVVESGVSKSNTKCSTR